MIKNACLIGVGVFGGFCVGVRYSIKVFKTAADKIMEEEPWRTHPQKHDNKKAK